MAASLSLSLAQAGTTNPVVVADRKQLPDGQLPSLLVALSAGAVLTYQIEVTVDQPAIVNPNDGSVAVNPVAVWYPVGALTGLSAGGDWLLTGVVTGVRARITSYTSGTLFFGVGQ